MFGEDGMPLQNELTGGDLRPAVFLPELGDGAVGIADDEAFSTSRPFFGEHFAAPLADVLTDGKIVFRAGVLRGVLETERR